VPTGRREPARQQADPPVIAAVGNVACNSPPSEHTRRCRYDAVADVEAIRSIGPDAYLALGDLHLHGSLEDFRTYYDSESGDLMRITRPVPGNHETYTL
jgi:hypothetical protein